MATEKECDSWRQELALYSQLRKDSGEKMNSARRSRDEAQNEADELEKGLPETRSDYDRARRTERHWNDVAEEENRKVAEYNGEINKLTWTISQNCS